MPGGVSGQKDCNFKYYCQRKTKKKTCKERLGVGKGIWEEVLHTKETAVQRPWMFKEASVTGTE